jgi:lipopolysaccharide transport system permease protein
MPELWRYRTLVKNLVMRDLKLKYRESAIGVAWSLLNPLLLLSVYTLAFRYVMRMPVPDYPFFLLVGLLPWNFFAAAALGSTGAIVENGPLLRKMYFPREALPIARVLFAFAQLLLALAVFLPAFLLFSDIDLRPAAALYFLVLLFHLGFAIGLALLLSALAARWRDIAHLTEVGLVLAFWATPIIYPASLAPPPLAAAFRLSPLAAFAIAYQETLFWGRAPAPGVLVAIALSATTALVLGAAVFRGGSPAFAERV